MGFAGDLDLKCEKGESGMTSRLFAWSSWKHGVAIEMGRLAGAQC